MIIAWAENAWADYLYWQKIDKNTLKCINDLVKDIRKHPFEGLGSPEPLKHSWSGYYSRRINKEHRIVYKFKGRTLFIAQCRYHY